MAIDGITLQKIPTGATQDNWRNDRPRGAH
jgi:hypothetical protein